MANIPPRTDDDRLDQWTNEITREINSQPPTILNTLVGALTEFPSTPVFGDSIYVNTDLTGFPIGWYRWNGAGWT